MHIVTQTQFLEDTTKRTWLRGGATEVQEVYVPSTYISCNGSLFKARNICYWWDKGGVGKECDERRSWILSLDEESIITRALVNEFIDSVLRSDRENKIGYAVGLVTTDVYSTPTAFLSKINAARQVAYYYSWLKYRMDGDEGITGFGGEAYFVKASADIAVEIGRAHV